MVRRLLQLENMLRIVVTRDVLKLLKSRLVKPVELENIPLISVTFDVLKWLKSRLVN
jgi:hypothetical protein